MHLAGPGHVHAAGGEHPDQGAQEAIEQFAVALARGADHPGWPGAVELAEHQPAPGLERVDEPGKQLTVAG